VLRYWEEEISFLEPEKNAGGRRVYGDKEMNLLYRLKYLVSERRFTLEGAKLALLEEMSGPCGNEKAEIHAQRKNLLDSLEALGRLKEESAEFTGSSFIPSGQEHLQEIWKTLPPHKRRNLSEDLLHLPPELLRLLAALHTQSPRAAASAQAELRVAPRESLAFSAAEECLASGRLALVTVLPHTVRRDAAAAALRQLALAVRGALRASGIFPVWYVFTAPERCAPGARNTDSDYAEEPRPPVSLRTLLCRGDTFFYDEEKIIFARQPFFPYLDEEGRLRAEEDGCLAGYASGMAGVLLVMSSPAFQRGLAARGIDTLCVLPLNRYSLNFPDRELLAGHCERGADLSVLCAPAGGGYAATGNYIVRPGFLSLPPLTLEENSADELDKIPVRKIRSSLSLYIGGAGTIWGIREDS
jgi:DNA-binding transcriptional MerR regulator